MKLLTALLLLWCLGGNECQAQLSTQDTALYLLFDKSNEGFYKGDSSKSISPQTMQWYWVNVYVLHNYRLYDGYPLEFESENLIFTDTIPLSEVSRYPVVTPEQLKSFVAANYHQTTEENPSYYASSYFDHLHHIYMIEPDSATQTATITPVKIDIWMDIVTWPDSLNKNK